jgi:outer membrane beta-barrel protein
LIRKVAFVLALLGAPMAFAQGLGLDLSQDDKKSDNKPAQEQKPADQQPAAAQPPPADAPSLTTAPEGPQMGEADIIEEDRVKSVQRKVYLKAGRFELAPFISVSVNDPFYTKWGESLRASYYLSDTLGIGIRGSRYDVLRTDDARVAKRTFQSRIFYSNPQWSALADVEWSPIYGKATIFNSIIHFDAYLLGGVGVVRTETSALAGHGPNPAVDLGAGVRFMVLDYLAVSGTLINTTYVDQPAGTTQGTTQNVMTLNTGISIFFPFHSTGKEAE